MFSPLIARHLSCILVHQHWKPEAAEAARLHSKLMHFHPPQAMMQIDVSQTSSAGRLEVKTRPPFKIDNTCTGAERVECFRPMGYVVNLWYSIDDTYTDWQAGNLEHSWATFPWSQSPSPQFAVRRSIEMALFDGGGGGGVIPRDKGRMRALLAEKNPVGRNPVPYPHHRSVYWRGYGIWEESHFRINFYYRGLACRHHTAPVSIRF